MNWGCFAKTKNNNKKKLAPRLNILWQHLLNISHFQNLFSFLSWPYYVTDNIPLYWPKWKVHSLVPFPHALVQLWQPSVIVLVTCVNPWHSPLAAPLPHLAKTIHHILPLCPTLPALASVCLPSPSDVGICVGAHPVPRRDACAWSRVSALPGQRWGEADVHTCMHKRESIKPHVKQTQHARLPFPMMESFYPHRPGGSQLEGPGPALRVERQGQTLRWLHVGERSQKESVQILSVWFSLLDAADWWVAMPQLSHVTVEQHIC